MLTTIECAGHPRDMGQAQGAASIRSLRAEVERLGLPTKRSRWPRLRPLATGSVRGTGAGREMLRHYAHLSERLEGVARAADLPLDSVLELHLRVRAGGTKGGLLSRRATLRSRALGGSGGEKRLQLERSLPGPIGGEAAWILRESRPAVGFRSVEVTLPWLVSSVAGVNECGLAVMGGPMLWGRSDYSGHASSMLLVQECLHRSSDLEGAIDWCLKRPVEGEQSILLCDASGALATLFVTGTERRVQVGEGELHLEGGEVPTSDSDSDGVQDASPYSVEDRVLLDAKSGSLRIELGGAELEVAAR